jgi:hypothetical protein
MIVAFCTIQAKVAADVFSIGQTALETPCRVSLRNNPEMMENICGFG